MEFRFSQSLGCFDFGMTDTKLLIQKNNITILFGNLLSVYKDERNTAATTYAAIQTSVITQK